MEGYNDGMENTVKAEWINTEKVGYWVGAILSPDSQQKIAVLLQELKKELPEVLWAMPAAQLHTTLFEIVMTFRDYDEDRDVLFEKYRHDLDRELTAQLSNQVLISIQFDTVEASTNAIIVRGTDDGSFQRIRDAISSKHLLPSGTRTPPEIIHSSIARYVDEIDVTRVQEVVAAHSVDFRETVSQLDLVRIWRMPMDFRKVKVYPLNK
jgi:hypothetical protein